MSDSRNEMILYQTDDGRTEVQLRALDGTVWLSQREMGILFNVSSKKDRKWSVQRRPQSTQIREPSQSVTARVAALRVLDCRLPAKHR